MERRKISFAKEREKFNSGWFIEPEKINSWGFVESRKLPAQIWYRMVCGTWILWNTSVLFSLNDFNFERHGL